ncbi:MAG: glutathione S-transferase [Pseudomonadota bacterium]
MLQLYAIPVSLYSAKTRILLRHKGLMWEEIAPPGGYGSDEYKTVVASGNLPALRDGDLLIGDSEAIAEYLEERHPEPPALPWDPVARARVRERSRFHDTRLEPALRTLFPHLPGRPSAPEGFVEARGVEINARLAQLAALIGADDTAGLELTLAECGFPITFAWIDALAPIMGFEVRWPDFVTAYRRRIDTLAPVAEELDQYRPRLANFLAAGD